MANDQNGAVPPRGWETPGSSGGDAADDSLGQLIEQLLALVPDELRVRLTAAARQLLEALRALIDWCVERMERRVAGEVEVRDIPIL